MKTLSFQAKHLTKSFKTPILKEGFKGAFENLFNRQHRIIKAVNSISFDIQQGEIVSYIGPNGAGKSTTIKLLTGIITPDSGEINILGMTYQKKRQLILKNIGVMFGNRSRLFWNLPVKESFDFYKDLYEINTKLYKSNCDLLFKSFEIDNLINKQVRTLSLGQRVRCELVVILLHSPKIIFLDEPTIGLDSYGKWKIREELKRINKELNSTIIITSHDTNDIDISNRIILIDFGKIIFDGNKESFINFYGQKNIHVKIEFNISDNLYLDDFTKIINEKNITNIKNNIIEFDLSKDESLLSKLNEIDKLSSVINFQVDRESLDEVIRNVYNNT